jgi:hypothetical protein
MTGDISLVVCAQRAPPAARVPRVLNVNEIKFSKSKVSSLAEIASQGLANIQPVWFVRPFLFMVFMNLIQGRTDLRHSYECLGSEPARLRISRGKRYDENLPKYSPYLISYLNAYQL